MSKLVYCEYIFIILLLSMRLLAKEKQSKPALNQELLALLKEKPTYQPFDMPRHAIQALLKTAKVTQPYNTNLPADISFICADIKYNNEMLKFCECGNAVYMSPTATSQLKIDHVSYAATAPYWGIFWHYLKQFNLPIWFVGKVKNNTIFAFENLKKLGGYVCDSLEDLDARIKQPPGNFTSTNNIKNYNGIIVYRSQYRYQRDCLQLKQFKKKHPDYLFVSHPARTYVDNKNITYRLFEATGLSEFLPHTKMYENQWSESLIPDILKSFSCNHLIIKPINLSCSNGIQLVTRENLNKTLTKGLKGTPREKFNLGFNYWHNQSHFMVSEFIQSKKIYVDGKPYDPTMRLVFILSQDKGLITCLPVGGFWKIPTHSLDTTTSLSNKHITRAHLEYKNSDIYFSGIPVNDEDMILIKSKLHEILPTLYETILSN